MSRRYMAEILPIRRKTQSFNLCPFSLLVRHWHSAKGFTAHFISRMPHAGTIKGQYTFWSGEAANHGALGVTTNAHGEIWTSLFIICKEKSYFIFIKKIWRNNEFHLKSKYGTYCKFRRDVKIKTLLSVVCQISKCIER